MKFIAFATALLSTVVAAYAAAAPGPEPSRTVAAANPLGSQIRTVVQPVYHLYLQNGGGKPILGPESSCGYFTLTGGAVSLNNPDGSKLYLNVNTSAAEVYKPLTLDQSPSSSTSWKLSGDTFVANNQQNFVVCPISGTSNYDLYLQTGNAVPSGRGCTNWVTIHLPCLC